MAVSDTDSSRDADPVPVGEALLELALTSVDPAGFLARAVPRLREALGLGAVAVVGVEAGQYRVLAEAGSSGNVPVALAAEALDRDAPAAAAAWWAVPIVGGDGVREVLLAQAAGGATKAARLREPPERVAPRLAQALTALRARVRQTRREQRLEAILAVAGQWYQTHDMEVLLERMAQAACQLLSSDRASIFLWDKANRALVGRPALGVEGNELRIPDDAGIVGQVVRGGQPRRVDAGHDQDQVFRQVDRLLGYVTRTLLCVPLRGRKGEIFGAFEVINKLSGDFTADDETALVELAAHAAIALENTQERGRLLESQRQIAESAAQGVQLIGVSPAIEALRSTIRRVAPTELAVLILGENGTGKEVVSQSIHYLSPRRHQPFIAVNCAALSETLLESELFGHEKGAFTDAHEARPGKFELASGGTLFLDEIGDLSLGGQAKLLRVLEEKVVVRVGGSKTIPTDTRVLAATNQDLGAMVREKRFRQDLYFRLNVVSVQLPPLRERPEDVLQLARHFLADFSRRARRRTPELSPAACARLEAHRWPGNVRELRNLMERLAYLCPGDVVEANDVAFILAPKEESPLAMPDDLPLAEATDAFQSNYIRRAIRRAAGNMSEAADRLGLHRSNLYRKLRQLGLDAEA